MEGVQTNGFRPLILVAEDDDMFSVCLHRVPIITFLGEEKHLLEYERRCRRLDGGKYYVQANDIEDLGK
ncbi:hypothetical protein [Bacteroides acidifaciens]|uniref:hypothetical protein n=1 Tax=Bacteroides acidifaciens TaxID=85831 RepID=UPI000469DA89|nr:hypothetical protein [Bacteroides acidifaciens]MCR1997707.1 hypothetical protein [Bacteroides acidifaciens]